MGRNPGFPLFFMYSDHLAGDQGTKQVHLRGKEKTSALRAFVAGRGAFRCTSL